MFKPGQRKPTFFMLSVFLLATAVPSFVWAEMHLSYLRGEAETRPADETEWRTLGEGESIPRDSQVKTEIDSYLELELEEDKSTLQLNETSGVNLPKPGEPIKLNYGSVSARIDTEALGREFELRTPNAVIGVRGTEFQVAYELEQESWTAVESGAVEVSASPGERLVAGEGGEVRFDPETDETVVSRLDEPRQELELTWQHWRENRGVEQLQAELVELKTEIDRLEKSVEEPLPPEFDPAPLERELQQLRQQKERLQSQLADREERYEQFREQYIDYRYELEEKREDFIQQRKQALDDFIAEREERFEEFRRDREERMRR